MPLMLEFVKHEFLFFLWDCRYFFGLRFVQISLLMSQITSISKKQKTVKFEKTKLFDFTE